MNWSKKEVVIFVLGSLFQLFLLLVYFDGLDWKIQYYSAREITEGLPFYEQKARDIDGVRVWTANHPPVFFYSLALVMKIFGTSQIVGRLMLWFYSNACFLLLVQLSHPKTSREFGFLAFLYYLNPITCVVLVLAIFDIFLFVYIFAALLLFEKKYYTSSSLIFGVGILTKTIPLLIVGILGLQLILRREFINSLKMTISGLLLSGTIIMILYHQYGDPFLRRLYEFQLERNTPNVSIWYAFFDTPLDSGAFLYFQLLVLIIGLLISSSIIHKDLASVCNSISLILGLFSLVLRNYYPHYGIWYMLPMIPVLTHLLRVGRTRELVLVISSYLFYSASLLICLFSCFDDPDPVRWMVQLHSLGHFIPTMVVLLVNIYLGINWKNYLSDDVIHG